MASVYPNSFLSILVPANAASALDKNQPMSFSVWAVNFGIEGTTKNVINQYQSYIKDWANITTENKNDVVSVKKQAYVSLIKEVFLDFSTDEERAILNKLDYQNPLHSDIALPFITKKLTNMVEFYRRKRHTLRYTPIQVDISGSTVGIEKTIFHTIIEHIRNNQSDYSSFLNDLKNNLNIEVVEFFDFYSNYFDAVTTEDTFSSNLLAFKQDPNLFLDFDVPLLELIQEYPVIISELKEPKIDVSKGYASSDNTERLQPKDFANTNDGDTIIALKKKFITKFIGADVYYLRKTDDGTVDFGILAKAENPTQNLLNIREATVSINAQTSELKTRKEVGIYTPAIQGLIFYRPSTHSYEIDAKNIKDGVTYIFPDPNRYGNIVGTSSDNTIDVPIIHHTSDVLFVRGIEENNFVFNKIKNETSDVLTFAYVSKQQKDNRKITKLDDNYDGINNFDNSTIVDYQEDLFGNRYYKLSFDNTKINQRLSGIISREQQINTTQSQVVVFNRGTFFEPDNSGPYDYTVANRIDTPYTTTERMGWGEFTTPTFDDFEPDFFLSFGTFDDDYAAAADGVDSIFVFTYDCNQFNVATPSYLTEDSGFPYPNINYPFDTVINSAIYSYLGNGEYVPTDLEHRDENFTLPPDDIGLIDLDGGYIEEEDTGNPLETSTPLYIIDPDPVAVTTINTVDSPDTLDTIYSIRKRETGRYKVKLSGSGNVLSLDSFASKISAKYGYTTDNNPIVKLDVADDMFVIRYPDLVVLEKVSFDGSFITAKTIRNNTLDRVNMFVSNPVFFRKKHITFIAACKFTAGVLNLIVKKLDAELNEVVTYYDSLSEYNQDLFTVNTSEDSDETLFNLDATKMIDPKLTLNESSGILAIVQPIYDTNDNPAFITTRLKLTATKATLVDVVLNMPEMLTAISGNTQSGTNFVTNIS